MLGYELGDKAEAFATKLKHIDLIVGAVIVVVLLALCDRFVVRRRRERELVQNNAD